MIEVLEAVEFKGIMEGGSTQPWHVTVLRGGEPLSYVVKLYKQDHIEENSTVLKECICSLLAMQFELETPEIALINFAQPFIDTLPPKMKELLYTRDQRVKFGTRLIDPPYENFSPALQSRYLESFDIGTIFAFDNLILNVDRRTEKPNLFFKKGRVLLIDHELTLQTTTRGMQSVENNTPWDHNYARHLFYQPIREMERSHQKSCFDTFHMYLTKGANFTEIDFLYDLLREHDHPTDIFFNIKSYLCALQDKADRFVSLLNDTVK
jgi:hypothetical protein